MSQPTTTTPTRIIILGAGLSGLAIAQALKHHNPPIPFAVFERDARFSLRSQGYRIRISPSGASALKRLLPPYLWDAFEATAARVEEGMSRIDAVSGEKSELFAGGPPEKKPRVEPSVGRDTDGEDLVGGRSFNVDRAVVRALLLSGLEEGSEAVFDKRAKSYAIVPESEGGGVEVHFADGSSERGAFLVGADGIRSVVRRQMLPDFRILDTEGRAVFGKTPILEELRAKVPPSIFEGIAVCKNSDEARIMLFCDIMHFDHATAAECEDKVGVRVPADYIYWVLGFRKDILNDAEKERELLRLSHVQSADLSLQMTETWHEDVKALFDHQTRDASSTLSILTAASGFEEPWSTKSSDSAGLVALMGDSAHPMPPVGGVGANTAWQDAYDLFSALQKLQGSPDNSERIAAVQAYEAKMLARAKPTVERSARGIGHLMGIKPIGELKEVK